MYPVTAIIPTRYSNNYLKNIVKTLEDDIVEDIFILDNGLNTNEKQTLETFSKVTIIPSYGESIYKMWNKGIDLTVQKFGINSYTSILNDDIVLYPKTVQHLYKVLSEDTTLLAISPDYERRIVSGLGRLEVEYVTSTFGHRGLGCFAFLLKNNPSIRLDESFGWWYGDDDMVKQILAHGKRPGKLLGLPVEHDQGTSFKHRSNELLIQINKDRQYFNSKYSNDQR